MSCQDEIVIVRIRMLVRLRLRKNTRMSMHMLKDIVDGNWGTALIGRMENIASRWHIFN